MQPGEDIGAEGIWGCVTKNGIPHFFIYDQIAGYMFRCLVTEDLLPQALAACQRRVEIMGTVLGAGRIRIMEIHNFPPAHQIPSPAEMRRLLNP